MVDQLLFTHLKDTVTRRAATKPSPRRGLGELHVEHPYGGVLFRGYGLFPPIALAYFPFHVVQRVACQCFVSGDALDERRVRVEEGANHACFEAASCRDRVRFEVAWEVHIRRVPGLRKKNAFNSLIFLSSEQGAIFLEVEKNRRPVFFYCLCW